MKEFTIYAETGLTLKRILRHGCCPDDDFEHQAQAGEGIIEGMFSSETHYILGVTATIRPDMSISIDKTTIEADNIDAITISGCPSGAIFTASNGDDRVSGPISSTDTFTTSLPGEYKLLVERWPYLDWEVTINAI